MIDPLYEQIVACMALLLLVLLCLPFARIQKLVLEVAAWVLRLALLGAAAYLWFHPENLPVEVTDTLSSFPRLRDLLPEPGAQHFGLCLASVIVLPLVPLLAV